MELSIGEMMLVALAIVVLFGPKKIPEIARGLGEGVRKMRSAMEDVKTEIMKETENPVSEIKKEIEKVKQQAMDFDPTEKIKQELDIKKHLEDKQASFEKKMDDSHEGPVSR